MTDGIMLPSATNLSTKEGCLSAANALATDFFQGMCDITYAWVEKYKLGTANELAAALNKSDRTIRGYMTELRKQGRIEASPKARDQFAAERCRKPVEKIEPQPINNSPKNGTTTTRVSRTTGGESGTSAPVEDDEGTVTVYHAGDDESTLPKTGSVEAERDYALALALVDRLSDISKRYYNSTEWSIGKWSELRGELDLIAETCRHKGAVPLSLRTEWCNSTGKFVEIGEKGAQSLNSYDAIL
jgi:hypothetical protein